MRQSKNSFRPESLGQFRLNDFLARRKWSAFPFQLETWRAFLSGKSGLVPAPTGSGKTLSVIGGPMIEALDRMDANSVSLDTEKSKRKKSEASRKASDPITVLWITPMRALANDTAHAIEKFAHELGLPWSIELRTSDTTQTMRKKQRDRLPTVLITTPESVSMLMSYPGADERLRSIRCVVVDEWHELLSTKRGTQAELALARLRNLSPELRVWGLSATLGNLDEAARVLLPNDANPLVIHSSIEKVLSVETLIPTTIEHFPWAGHMGLRMVEPVAKIVEGGGTTLIFVNTRAQSEIWFRQLLEARPDWIGKLAIHHGSLDRKLRLQVEALLREGSLIGAVCTSSLDLGVDFPAVDQVIQISSPKGIGRLLQRAGRSGHRPGEISRIYCAPTHAFELIEFSAAREGIALREVEPRAPLIKPLDVLVQH
ncbi:MAG TPA: DEAD/DEAH box helicase, partial [Tepidisphaeraceae bacterium]|nr:DEAD/DEAH box helicase [Tepidisphaeraceae bacterium]